MFPPIRKMCDGRSGASKGTLPTVEQSCELTSASEPISWEALLQVNESRKKKMQHNTLKIQNASLRS